MTSAAPDYHLQHDRWTHRRRNETCGVSGEVAAVTARKLAALLWRKFALSTNYSASVSQFDRLEFKPIPESAEGVTRWDICNTQASDGVVHFCSNMELLDNQGIATSVASARQNELFKAQKRIKQLEDEHMRLRMKLKQFTMKLNEEKDSWIRTQHQKMCAKVEDLKDDIRREKKFSKKIDYLNTKMLRDITEAKLLARKFKKSFEEEKKARKKLENVCNDLAEEIKGGKGEIWALRDLCGRIEREVEEEKKLLQLAEVWREERVQMKLVGAKLITENKYCMIKSLIADLEALLRSSKLTTGKNEILSNERVSRKTLHVNVPYVKYSSEAHNASKLQSRNRGAETNSSGKETVTQADNANPIRILDGSEGSLNKISGCKYISEFDAKPNKNAHHESRKSKAGEVSLVSLKQAREKSWPVCKIERNLFSNENTTNVSGSGSLSNGSMSSVVSQVTPQGKVNGNDLVCQWRSREMSNPHIVRAMRGSIEWPRGIQKPGPAQVNRLEAKVVSRKMFPSNLLKHRS